ncbi:MAG: amidohydrolase family protein, partial [Planctomycetes bacterium]|nr:amidohydrolase family protein [Planctomycetota bacterium]
MTAFLIRGGRLVDPARGVDGPCDLRVSGSIISELGTTLTPLPDESVLDASGLIVTPGLVDLCVHLREPGFEEIETIRTGASAALAGGFTAIAAMPDTDPPVDNEASAAYVRLKGEQAGGARVYPVGSLTRAREGSQLSEMAGMKRAGAVAFSDEESAVERTDIFLKALRYAGMLDRPVMTRSEDRWLRGNGVVNNGLIADLLGLPAISAGTEEVMLGRNLHLSRLERAPLHLLHLSTRASMAQVMRAKSDDVPVTCSVAAPHLVLDEREVRNYDPAFKFMPPLR